MLYVYGENFTESSKILTDGKKRETYYVSGELIMTPNVAEASSVTVAQIAENGFVFGEITAELYTGADFDFEINISEEK